MAPWRLAFPQMFQARIHGRGGQGVVTAAELLSLAAFAEGLEAQAFPSFGSERMGAPVVAFCRTDTKLIRLREPIAEPDAVIIQDPTLLYHVDVFGGLTESGYVLINSARSVEELGLADLLTPARAGKVVTVPAGELARARTGRPIPNAALLGAFAAMTSVVSQDSIEAAIRGRFKGKVADSNAAAARDAFDYVREPVHA